MGSKETTTPRSKRRYVSEEVLDGFHKLIAWKQFYNQAPYCNQHQIRKVNKQIDAYKKVNRMD